MNRFAKIYREANRMAREYTLQQAADLLGISKDTLRYYEKEGLITPQKAANGYRYYTLENIRQLQDIVYYRDVDMSLSEIKAIFKESTPEFWENILRFKMEEERNQIRRHQMYLKKLQLFSNYIDVAKNYTFQMKLKPFPKSYIIYRGCNGFFQEDGKIGTNMYDTIYGWTYELYDMLEESKIPIIYRAIGKDEAKELGVQKMLRNNEVLDFPLCVNGIVKSPCRTGDRIDMGPILKWAKEHNLQTDHFYLVRYVINTCENGSPVFFLEIFVPCRYVE